MSSTNAPQPDAGASAPAEVFDSTIMPAQGQVSQDQLPGGNTSEAPMHSGEVNGIDPFFYQQFMALTSFNWDTSMSPGQLLWSIPIHPQFVHQFMAHISKMYNAFAGGFDFAVTVAGTGFHAGKLMVARIPPNIKPETLLTAADITAFPYMVIDPKTLETVVKSAMDQRNVMYHYMPFDKDNFQSFGGYLAIYCLLPLNTSSTGATQISVQVFSKPAREFMFTQLKPIVNREINVYKPESLERALDFRTYKTGTVCATNINSMTCLTATDVKTLKSETYNCVKLDGTPMNATLFERYDAVPRIDALRFTNNIKSFDMGIKDEGPLNASWYFGEGTGDKSWAYFSFDGIKVDTKPETVSKVPQFLCSNIVFTFHYLSKWVPSERTGGIGGTLRLKQSDDKEGMQKYVFATYVNSNTVNTYLDKNDNVTKTGMDLLFQQKQIDYVTMQLNGPVTFDADAKDYAPPITESLLVFNTTSGDVCQPWEVRSVILESSLGQSFKQTDSLVFELMDSLVDLPLLPVRLHWSGYFTTIPLKKDLVYKFEDPQRYYMKFVGIIPETTPMVGGRLPISETSAYMRNAAVSRFAQ